MARRFDPPAATGTLYVVATPIGNPEDLSARAERTLREVALIAAEDTRVTRRLLHRRGFSKPLLSFYDHNEAERTPQILRKLDEGLDVALVSDAGTPLISDPGFRLVKAAAAAGRRIVPVPGPCAAIAALSISGLATDRFLTVGFLPRRSSKRRATLEKLRREQATLVFFEAPHRAVEALSDLLEILGDRHAVLARNLTKEHESVLRGRLGELRKQLGEQELVTGEMTLVVEGQRQSEGDAWPGEVDRAIERLLAEGLAPSVVQKIVSDVFRRRRRDVYQRILAKAAP